MRIGLWLFFALATFGFANRPTARPVTTTQPIHRSSVAVVHELVVAPVVTATDAMATVKKPMHASRVHRLRSTKPASTRASFLVRVGRALGIEVHHR